MTASRHMAHAAVAVAATVMLALVAAGCGGSSGSHVAQLGSTGAQSSTSTGKKAAGSSAGNALRSALGFTRCMRSHGVSTFPDPTGSGAVPKVSLQQLGVSSSQFDAAQTACQRLLPAGSEDVFPPGEVQQLLPGMRRFSQCVRSHGMPNWPDPTVDSAGRPGFNLVGVNDVDPTGRAVTECQHLLPSALGGLPVSQP